MIALVNVVQGDSPEAKPLYLPLGLIYLGSALKEAGYPVKLYHITQYQIEETARQIAISKPLFMGVSVLTGVSTLHNLVLSQWVRNLEPKIPIIWGGHHPTATPELCLTEPCIDYVFMGEGEESIVQFAKAIEANKGFEAIPGLVMKKDGTVRWNSPPVLIKDLDTLDFDLGLLDNVSQYVSGSRQSMIFQSSRGCPFRCGFCDIANFYSHSYREFSVEYVLRHAKQYKDRYGVKSFHMTDDILFLKERDLQIMRGLVDLGMRPDTVAVRISYLHQHPEIMKALDEFKATSIFLAWESGVDRILRLMRKGISREIIFQTIRFLADKYPHITYSGGGIIGSPTETWEEIRQTVKTAVEMRSIHPNCNIFLQLYLPLPGTDFLDLAVREGMTRPERTEEWAYRDPFWSKRCQIDWLPWATNKQKQMLVTLDFYSRQPRTIRAGGRPTQMVAGLFSEIARYRYNHLFFVGSEIDMWLFDKLAFLRRRFLRGL